MYSELWNKWNGCHDDVDQQKRIASAKKAACSPLVVDFTTGEAKFSGSSGEHTTTLEHCSCIDFNRRRLPCKHMYRLAMEFELMNEAYDTDLKAVLHKEDATKIPIGDTVKIVESMTYDQQELLCHISEKISSTYPIAYIPNSNTLQSLFDSGIIVDAKDINGILAMYKKTELVSLAENLKLDPPRLRKQELAAWILDNAGETLSSIELNYVSVKYSPKIKSGKLRMYLHRKFDKVYTFIEGIMQFSEVPLTETILPEDDVTELLRKYGHYKF